MPGGFASDPFKGSDPFAADVLFPEGQVDDGAGHIGDEADTSLSCAETKASTGTQCFESEFPNEDSDIEISYSQEDLDAIAQGDDPLGFKPIQSSSEELGPVPIQGWRSQGQYSIESDPNGYELDLGAVSPPSDIEELSLGYPPEEAATKTTAGLEQGHFTHTHTHFSNVILIFILPSLGLLKGTIKIEIIVIILSYIFVILKCFKLQHMHLGFLRINV